MLPVSSVLRVPTPGTQEAPYNFDFVLSRCPDDHGRSKSMTSYLAVPLVCLGAGALRYEYLDTV